MISEPKPSALIIGSISLDTLNLPMGDAYDLLGGSAAYAAIACSKLAQPHLVSAVGADFPSKHRGALDELRIDLAGLRVHDDGQTLAWGARYDESLSEPEMLWARLGVFEAFTPEIPTHCRDCRWVLLANLPPLLQRHAWEQLRAPEFIVADTMSMWIEADRESVWSVMCEADLALMGQGDAYGVGNCFQRSLDNVILPRGNFCWAHRTYLYKGTSTFGGFKIQLFVKM